ncbi:hypothetical protein QYE76_024896 [Lolium multiflorum]|uniref:Uncharacterized protein n=1 Tax=Lolium multiflorum TaxID=4521 RepID=A0AAD8RGZ5_LOLMU|nr:hypothetical protein QYE76_024896 [Lolium multiflorum]
MASSAAEPAPPPPPPPGGGEGSASTRSGSTPVLFVIPSGVPPIPVSRGEDWESEGSNAWIPSGMDPALAFRLVVRLDSSFTRDSKRYKNGFYFPAVVATTISLRDFKANIYDNKIRIHVDRGQASSGAGASSGGRASCLSTAAASANSVHRGAPCRSTAAPSVPSASGSQIVRTVDVEDDADIEDQSPQDDEDELMFPELVDRCSKQAMEDQYMEDIAFGARFDDTDDEEKNENNDNLVLANYEGDDLPTIEWNREDPQLAEGTVFQTMMDCRNAITTYCILSKNNYEVIKNDSQHLEHDVVTTTRHASARTGLATDTPVHRRAPSTPPTPRPLLVPAASPRRQRARGHLRLAADELDDAHDDDVATVGYMMTPTLPCSIFNARTPVVSAVTSPTRPNLADDASPP